MTATEFQVLDLRQAHTEGHSVLQKKLTYFVGHKRQT